MGSQCRAVLSPPTAQLGCCPRTIALACPTPVPLPVVGQWTATLVCCPQAPTSPRLMAAGWAFRLRQACRRHPRLAPRVQRRPRSLPYPSPSPPPRTATRLAGPTPTNTTPRIDPPPELVPTLHRTPPVVSGHVLWVLWFLRSAAHAVRAHSGPKIKTRHGAGRPQILVGRRWHVCVG